MIVVFQYFRFLLTVLNNHLELGRIGVLNPTDFLLLLMVLVVLFNFKVS